jgi:putative transposase
MPWAERSIVKLRKEFVMKALSKDGSMTALCREYGISRKTGYKWIERFQKGGLEELVDASRRPAANPLRTSAEVTLEILALRKAHQTWGPRKLHRLLERKLRTGTEVPSVRTIARVLRRARLVRKRRRRPIDNGWSLQRARQLVVVEQANDLWTVDFKGWWPALDGARCEPLTVRDAHSRYILALQILPSTHGTEVRLAFEELFERYGLPRTIQSDNGPPFASAKSLCGLTRLSVWWLALGIMVVRSRPGCPQDNGGHERMHADMKVELQADAAPSVAAQQLACDEWRVEFNHVRPHEALDLKTPAEVYRPSPRRPDDIAVGGYFPDHCEVMPLDRRGGFTYRGQRVFVAKPLRELEVGVETPKVDDEVIRVWFHRLLLGVFAVGTGRIEVSVEPFRKPDLLPPASVIAPAPAAGDTFAGNAAGAGDAAFPSEI